MTWLNFIISINIAYKLYNSYDMKIIVIRSVPKKISQVRSNCQIFVHPFRISFVKVALFPFLLCQKYQFLICLCWKHQFLVILCWKHQFLISFVLEAYQFIDWIFFIPSKLKSHLKITVDIILYFSVYGLK